LIQFAISEFVRDCRIIPLPQDRHLLAAACKVPVQAVIGDVELAAFEPADQGRVIIPLKHPVPAFEPGDKPFCLFRPEALGIGQRTRIHRLVVGFIDMRRFGDSNGDFIKFLLRRHGQSQFY
jgi:hypothetical protein